MSNEQEAYWIRCTKVNDSVDRDWATAGIPDSPALRKMADHPELVPVALSRDEWIDVCRILHADKIFPFAKEREDAIRAQLSGGGDA